MNDVAPPALRETNLEPGASLVLVDPARGWLIRKGRLEIYALLWRDGVEQSGRYLLCEVPTGGIVPPIDVPAGLQLSAIATEPALLLPLSAGALAKAEHRGAIAPRLDGWIEALATLVGELGDPRPDELSAVEPGTEFELAAGASVAARSGVVWVAGTGLAYPGGTPLPLAPVANGVWLAAGSAGSARSSATVEVLGQPGWPAALAAFHDMVLGAVARHLEGRKTTISQAVAERATRTSRLLDRLISRFGGVLGRSDAQSHAVEAEERFLEPMRLVATALGDDFTAPVREAIARAGSIADAVRAARYRERQIALRGPWWREDLGPLIGYLDGMPVALLPEGKGRWRVSNPAGGPMRRLDAALAGRLAPHGHMLYRPLPARPLALRDLWSFAWHQNRPELFIALATGVIMGILSLATPVAMRMAFNDFIPAHETLQLGQLAVGLLLAALVSAGFRIAYDMAFLRIEGRTSHQTFAAVIDRILRMPGSILRFASADLALRAGSVDSVRRTLVNVMSVSTVTIFLWLLNGVLMAWYAPFAAAIAVAVFLILMLVAYLVAAAQADALRRGEQLHSDVNTVVFQLVNGITALRASGAEDRAFGRWGQDFAEMRSRAFRSQKISTYFETCLAGFDVLTLAGVFLLLSLMPKNALSTGAFMSFIWSYGAFMGSSGQLARSLVGLLGLKVSWDRAAPILKASPDAAASKRDPGTLKGAVELSNVYFRYGPELPFAAAGLSIKVEPGQFIALVGRSGSGKSTAMRLLLGSDAPQSGAVTYDGADLRNLDPILLRRQIGVVLQRSRLSPGSLFENVMGAHNGTIEDAWEAVRHAGLEADIRALPMGLQTRLSDAASTFSGGQVQRLLIARALAGRPRILLLDEATSALDAAVQAIVTESLARLAVTRIVVAHRLATIKSADRIYVIDKGKVVQTGRFDELAGQAGPFADLLQRQLL